MAKRLCLLLVVLVIAAGCAQSGGGAGSPLNGAAVHMIDAQVGWAYSQHLIARTTDGAQTFRAVTPPNLPDGAQLDPPLFVDAQHAFAFAIVWNGSTLKTSALERTSDGGATWRATPMSPAVHGDLTFFDGAHGWFVSSEAGADALTITDTLWRTTDGGSTWRAAYRYAYRVDVHPSTVPGGCYWQGSIAWSSPTHGIVGVSCPFDAPLAVDVTDDAGSTWTRRVLPAGPGRPGVVLFSGVGPVHLFAGGLAVAMVGRCIGSDGTSCTPYDAMYRSDDGGLTWEGGQIFRGGDPLVSIDADHAWTVGCLDDGCFDVGLLATSDGGVQWQLYPLRKELGPNMHGSRVYSFVTAELGFVAASNELDRQSTYFKTTDGGRTFSAIQPQLEGS